MRAVVTQTGLSVALLLSACGGPQAQDEASLIYRASFRAEPGVQTTVVFPFVGDGAAAQVQAGLTVTDGGSVTVEDQPEGRGLVVAGQGAVTVLYDGAKVKGVDRGAGVPQAQLTRQVPDAGTTERYFRVNKGGVANVQVDFEYTATRDCGPGCGGSRSWTYLGPVGLAVQQVSVVFSEAKR